MSSEPHRSSNGKKVADFESAMATSGFGLFNICLLLASIPGLWAHVFETTTMSLVLPVAECDLQLTVMDKAALNAVTFAGLILSSLPWGYVADTFSRKYTLISSLLMEGAITLLSLLSRNAVHLMIFKFFGGFMSGGPVSTFISYISEFHGRKYRVYIVIVIGLIKSLPLTILPGIASVVLPSDIEFNIGSLRITSWKVFIAITAIPSLLSGSLLFFFPESPKFLMSRGKNDKAIQGFSRIYAINKFKPRDSYPIKTLRDEAPERLQKLEGPKNHRKEISIKIQEGLGQLKLIVNKSHLKVTLMFCFMFFCTFMSTNSIRLWHPQEFATLEEMRDKGYKELTTCSVLQYSLNQTKQAKISAHNQNHTCAFHINSAVYMDSVIVSASLTVNYILSICFVKIIGNKILLELYLGIMCVSHLINYWSVSRTMILGLSSIYVACGIVCSNLMVNASINLYPTNARTMAMTFLSEFGRLGSIIGNLILPPLISLHCSAIFLFFSVFILLSLIIAFFLPNATRDPLK